MGYPYISTDNGTFGSNRTFFDISSDVADYFSSDNYTTSDLLLVGKPIGARCVYFSEPGTATISARTSSFDSLERIDPLYNGTVSEYIIPPFGTQAIHTLNGHIFELLSSTNSAPPLGAPNSGFYPNFISSDTLKQAILCAFAADALQLMYDGLNGIGNTYHGNNLTSSRMGKVLGPGSVPPSLSAILLCIWAFACIVLGCMYGFRPRWSEQLDGFTMLRYGVHLSDKITDPSVLVTEKLFEECEALRKFPAL